MAKGTQRCGYPRTRVCPQVHARTSRSSEEPLAVVVIEHKNITIATQLFRQNMATAIVILVC